MDWPRITVVTPSFNQAAYLPETIESILAQDYPNLEYMILDGGSTDGSVEIISKYAPHLAYWVSQPDEGQSDAINKGFRRSTGELFAWVNSDDVMLPGCLKAVADCYLHKGKPDIIHSNVVYIDAEGRPVRFVRVPRQTHFLFCRGVWYGQAPSVFFKSALYGRVGALRKKYHMAMDLDVWGRMFEAGARAEHIPHYLGAFRKHEQAKTFQYTKLGPSHEDAETAEIFRSQCPRSTLSTRTAWRYAFKAYQVLNLNYLRAYVDSRTLGDMTT